MLKKIFITSFISFIPFVFAQETVPKLSVKKNTELMGKKLEYLNIKEETEKVKPPTNLPKLVDLEEPTPILEESVVEKIQLVKNSKNELVPNKEVKEITEEKIVKKESTSNKISSELKNDLDNIHNLIGNLSKSLKKGSGELIAKNFDNHFGAIFSDQTFVSKAEGIINFFDNINKSEIITFGGMVLDEKFHINISKDGFSANLFGKGIEKYKVKDSFFEIPISWTMNLVKINNEWKIAGFHSGVNFIENDLIKSYESLSNKTFFIGLFSGLFIGLILPIFGFFIYNKKYKN